MAAGFISSSAHEGEPARSRAAAAAMLKIRFCRMTFTSDVREHHRSGRLTQYYAACAADLTLR